MSRALADTVVLAHFAFVLFVVLGGFLVLRWRWAALVHVPAVLWGAFVELASCVCPLTPLENWLRSRAGDAGYAGGFVEHYVLPVLYPPMLTRSVQLGLGVVVLVVNACIYWHVIRRAQGMPKRDSALERRQN